MGTACPYYAVAQLCLSKHGAENEQLLNGARKKTRERATLAEGLTFPEGSPALTITYVP